MSIRRQLARGLRALSDRAAADRDIADEVEHYLDEATAELVRDGLPPDEARRAARRALGSAQVVREEVRAYGWENAAEALFADLRYAARRLRGSPGFAAVGVLTLALGIGASTAIFSAVNPVLFEPLPYPQAGRVAAVWDLAPDGARIDVTFGTFREVAARSRSFDALAVLRPWQPTLTGGVEPERLEGQRVSADYFRVLGVPPALGRAFEASDDQPGGPRVAVLADGLWRRRFAADPAIVGRTVSLGGNPYTVVGVMPKTFENVLAPSAEIWAPLQYDPALPREGREWGHHLRMVGRLRAGVGPEQATRELGAIAREPVAEFARVPWAGLERGLVVNPLRDDVARAARPALLAVLGAVLLLLAIACVNVTNLLLARGARRRGEFAMRAALGAGRGRLVQQLLTESLMLAALGGALGMAVAELGVRALVALAPPGLPRLDAVRLDGAVFAFGLGVSTLVGLVVGVIPALQASRSDLHGDLQRGSRRTAGGHATRGALVVAEVALALLLLVGAGLLMRSLGRLLAVPPGFDPSNMLVMQVQTAGGRLADDSATRRFFAGALAAVEQVPGVAAAAFTSQLPLAGDFERYGAQFESAPVADPEEDQSVFRYAVTPGYFAAMGVPLRRGRLLDERDAAGAPRAVLISESLARRRLPGVDPIGQRVHVGSTDQPWYTVVGVVGDVRQASLAVDEAAAAYVTTDQWYFADRALWLVVRTRGDAAALAPAVRRAVWSVDKDQPIVRVATMSDLVAASAAERRFALALFQAFGIVALALAATGIYGVLSGSVAERTREIGVRSALGAPPGAILALVARQGMTLAAVGVAIGLVGAAAASRAVDALLFGVTRLDPGTYVGVSALLLAAAGVACWLPAWRAARVDPTITLRAE